MIPYRAGKLTPNLSHLTRGLVKYVPGRGYFCAVPSQNGDKYVTSPPPPPIVELVLQYFITFYLFLCFTSRCLYLLDHLFNSPQRARVVQY